MVGAAETQATDHDGRGHGHALQAEEERVNDTMHTAGTDFAQPPSCTRSVPDAERALKASAHGEHGYPVVGTQCYTNNRKAHSCHQTLRVSMKLPEEGKGMQAQPTTRRQGQRRASDLADRAREHLLRSPRSYISGMKSPCKVNMIHSSKKTSATVAGREKITLPGQ